MTAAPPSGDWWEARSFLVPPGEVSDWRMVLLVDAAVEAGLLAALPATPGDLASALGLDGHAVGVVLGALATWEVVSASAEGTYTPGPRAPGGEETAVLRHHARTIRRWSAQLGERLRGAAGPAPPSGARGLEVMLDGLAVNARASAPGAIDACVARVPGLRRALDVGGGHGEYALELARRGLDVTMQDRAEVIDRARRGGRLEEAGIRLFAGDFFEALPEGQFDLVFCAGVVYTYGAERNVELYRRLRPLAAPDGALAVHTFLRGTDPLAAIFAVQMLAGPGSGDSHSEDDHREWLATAGFTSVAVCPLPRRPEWLLLAR